MLYYAYGSNLNQNEMMSRCPNGKFLGMATVDDYELEFRYYLSVRPNTNSKLLVGVWEVSDDDLDSLDYYEGYPTLYRRTVLKAHMGDKMIEGIIYIMNDNKGSYGRNTMPSYDYLQRCVIGYMQCEMPTEQINKAFERCL